MALTPIEIIATIFAILGLIKIIVILISKRKWLGVTKIVYGNPEVSKYIFLILAVIVFYYLIQVLSIVQIIAVTAFMGLLIGVMFMAYSKELLSFADKLYKQKFSGWIWFYTLIWTVLMIWALYEIFLV